jgi:hypothetical protein
MTSPNIRPRIIRLAFYTLVRVKCQGLARRQIELMRDHRRRIWRLLFGSDHAPCTALPPVGGEGRLTSRREVNRAGGLRLLGSFGTPPRASRHNPATALRIPARGARASGRRPSRLLAHPAADRPAEGPSGFRPPPLADSLQKQAAWPVRALGRGPDGGAQRRNPGAALPDAAALPPGSRRFRRIADPLQEQAAPAADPLQKQAVRRLQSPARAGRALPRPAADPLQKQAGRPADPLRQQHRLADPLRGQHLPAYPLHKQRPPQPPRAAPRLPARPPATRARSSPRALSPPPGAWPRGARAGRRSPPPRGCAS